MGSFKDGVEAAAKLADDLSNLLVCWDMLNVSEATAALQQAIGLPEAIRALTPPPEPAQDREAPIDWRQSFEERFCTCGAGHGSLEGHVNWCHWLMLDRFCAALESANEMCRSAMSIAERNGAETNWSAFKKKLKKSLLLQQDAILAAGFKREGG